MPIYKPPAKNFSKISLLGLGMMLMSLIIILRLAYWQIFNNQDLVESATKQIFASKNNLASRGSILTSDLSTVVGTQHGYQLSIDKRYLNISNEEITKLLAPITWQIPEYVVQEASNSSKIIRDINEEQARLQKLIENPNTKYVTVANNLILTPDNVSMLSKIDGLILQSQHSRIYTQPITLPHVLGFVGKDNLGNTVGRYGLEGYYELELAGRSGVIKREKDNRGRSLIFGQKIETPRIDGRTLITSIDRTIQFIVEKELEQGLQTYQASAGTVIVMEPQTGAILAMASLPDYHPGWYEYYPNTVYSNPAIGSSFEPGSIFKVIVIASALDNQVISLNTICPCNNTVRIGSNVISNYDNKIYPNSSMVDILKHSDNIGMVYIGKQMGIESMIDGLQKFGFGSKTNIDLEEEMSPRLRPINQWREIDLATASFGQGVAVTPIQMITAVNVLANHGVLMEPYIVKELIENDKNIQVQPNPVRQVISPQTSKDISTLMSQATDYLINNQGRKDLKGYNIAGKTGTAQIPIEGQYHEDKVMASYIGFAPYDNPKFVMLVTLNDPRSANFASQTAAPLWFNIAKQLFQHWNIQPDLQ